MALLDPGALSLVTWSRRTSSQVTFVESNATGEAASGTGTYPNGCLSCTGESRQGVVQARAAHKELSMLVVLSTLTACISQGLVQQGTARYEGVQRGACNVKRCRQREEVQVGSE